MCGRYSLDDLDLARIAQFFASESTIGPATSTWQPSYNVCPMTHEPIVVQDHEGRRLGLTRWGWKRPFLKNRPLINARGDDILTGKTTMFSKALRERRCVIPAANFYEWRRDEHDKPLAPYAIAMLNKPIFGMAGLWETEYEDGCMIGTHLVLTVQPNSVMAPIHDREPMILRSAADVDCWLNPASTVTDIADLLIPVPSDDMRIWQVSKAVNSIKNKGPELVVPVIKDQNFLWN